DSAGGSSCLLRSRKCRNGPGERVRMRRILVMAQLFDEGLAGTGQNAPTLKRFITEEDSLHEHDLPQTISSIVSHDQRLAGLWELSRLRAWVDRRDKSGLCGRAYQSRNH